jgi:hypothetical protein
MTETLYFLARKAFIFGLAIAAVGLFKTPYLFVPLDLASDIEALCNAEESIGVFRLSQAHVSVY